MSAVVSVAILTLATLGDTTRSGSICVFIKLIFSNKLDLFWTTTVLLYLYSQNYYGNFMIQVKRKKWLMLNAHIES